MAYMAYNKKSSPFLMGSFSHRMSCQNLLFLNSFVSGLSLKFYILSIVPVFSFILIWGITLYYPTFYRYFYLAIILSNFQNVFVIYA